MLILRYLTIFTLCFLSLPVLAADTSLIARMQKVESSLVEIKTVYAKKLMTEHGHTGIASFERHGTGIIVDPSGIIVTNTHIIVNAPQILVGLSNGKAYEAKVLYASDADFSFIKIDTPYKLKSIDWADSSQAQIGQEIVALGDSQLNYQSILGGEITSLIQSVSTGDIEMLELNLELFHGDSGGPVMDKDGNLLGLIMAKEKNTDRKSYAIASDKIRQEYLKLKENMP